MAIKWITQIQKSISDIIGSEININNTVQALSTDNPLLTTNDLIIDHTDIKTWNLDQASGAAFSLDIFSLLNIATANLDEKAKIIHVQCHKRILKSTDRVTPIRFQVSADGNAIGKMSQLSLVTIDELFWTTLTISDIVLGAGEEAILTILIGVDK